MAKILTIGGKVSDMFWYDIYDTETDEILADQNDGYVPSELNVGGGDYIEMRIDIETGTIRGWKQIDIESLK